MAHIGVIEQLEQDGFEIVEIIGCSMGAVVGGLYAGGHLPAYKEWLLSLQRGDVFRQMDFTLTTRGFLKGEKVFQTMLEMTGACNIEDLRIPFRAVACDLENGEEVVFDRGDLMEALRASIAIPGIFTPFNHQGRYLIDGGVINPLPVNLLKQREDALVIAVNINSPGPPPAALLKNEAKPAHNWLNINWPIFKKDEKISPDQNLFSILGLSYEHMQNRLIDLTSGLNPPDLLVNVKRSSCGMFDFHKAQELITAGELAYREAKALKEKEQNYLPQG